MGTRPDARTPAERLSGWRARRQQPGAEMTLTEHLEELRYRLLISIAALAAGLTGGWRLTPHVIDLLERSAGRLVVVTPAEGFFTYLKIAFVIGLAMASPVIVAQVWLFVAPALYPHEVSLAARIAPVAGVLFALGLVFGGAIIYPVAMRFLIGQAGQGVTPALSVSRFVSFFTGLVLPFGLVFEMPAAAYGAGRLGIVEPARLSRLRRWAILLAFIVAAVLTPPDVISQLLMAGPLVVLYEVSVVAAAWGARVRRAARPAGAVSDAR
ncbi:MAG: twin-arginine translocase subunit TatC [Bacillota bacterium]